MQQLKECKQTVFGGSYLTNGNGQMGPPWKFYLDPHTQHQNKV